MFVKDVMNLNPFILNEDDTILHASSFMKEERIRNLPVVDASRKLVGLLTLREIIETMFKNPDKILVKDSMIKIVGTVGPDTLLKDAVDVMIKNQYGALPVIDKNKKLLGMITEQYLLKTLYKLEAAK